MLHQQMPHYGNPQPFNGQAAPANSGQRVQKQNLNQNDKKSDKKEKKNKNSNQEKKYVSKQPSPKKEVTAEAK